MSKDSGVLLLVFVLSEAQIFVSKNCWGKGKGDFLLMTVGGMDADTERTGMYSQRVMSEEWPFLPHYY